MRQSRFLKSAQIILLSIVAACAYGVIHDEVTVRLCLEYFSIAHPPLFHTGSPTLLAMCWGVAATAGLGAVFGSLLALVSQSRGAAPYPIRRLGRSILALLAFMGISALLAGIGGYQLAQRGFISLPTRLAGAIPAYQHDRFMAVWFAHGASYLAGLSGGALLCFRVWRARGRPSVISVFPQTFAGAARAAFIAGVAIYVVWTRL